MNDLKVEYDVKCKLSSIVNLINNGRYNVTVNTWQDTNKNQHLNASIDCLYNGEFGDTDIEYDYNTLLNSLNSEYNQPFFVKIDRVVNGHKTCLFCKRAELRGIHKNKSVLFFDLVGV